jgi:hypothetical protein
MTSPSDIYYRPRYIYYRPMQKSGDFNIRVSFNTNPLKIPKHAYDATEKQINNIYNKIILSKSILLDENHIKQDIKENCRVYPIIKQKHSYDVSDCFNTVQDIDYSCCICMSVYYNPMLLPCSHTMCSECIYSIKTKICALCREPFSYYQLVKNNSMSELINELIVKCNICNEIHKLAYECEPSNPDVYCYTCDSEKMKLSEFINHYILCCLNKCQFCCLFCTKTYIKAHENVCPERNCKTCGKHKTSNIIDGSHVCYKLCKKCFLNVNFGKKCQICYNKYNFKVCTKKYDTKIVLKIKNDKIKNEISYKTKKTNKTIRKQWIVKR